MELLERYIRAWRSRVFPLFIAGLLPCPRSDTSPFQLTDFGFSHHAVCCFPKTSPPGGWPLASSNLVRKVFSMRSWAEGILQAWPVRRQCTKHRRRASECRKNTEERMVDSPTHHGERATFSIFGYCPITAGIALKPRTSLSFSRLTLPFPLLVLLSRKTVRQWAKGGEDQKKESKKGERERERDDKEVGPWPAIHTTLNKDTTAAKGRGHQH